VDNRDGAFCTLTKNRHELYPIHPPLPPNYHPADPQQHLHDVRLVRPSEESGDIPWYIAALVSWGIALFEYLLQVPANRIGFQQAGFSVGQLKIMQEVITLLVFVPFAVFYLNEPLKLDYVWAGLCLVGAVYFIFRSA
jgi:uncharacterized protein (DUF486 family)